MTWAPVIFGILCFSLSNSKKYIAKAAFSASAFYAIQATGFGFFSLPP